MFSEFSVYSSEKCRFIPISIVSYGLFPQMEVDYVDRRYRRLHFFIRTILKEHRGSIHSKIKNIPASELMVQCKIQEH